METKRCYGCMGEMDDGIFCQQCGYDSRRVNEPHQLPQGTVLRDRYLIGRALGQGGFGITYIGWDMILDVPVAVKEYYPAGVVNRESSQSHTLTVITGREDTRFAENRDRFLREARTLAKLQDVPEVVHIRDFFPENNTAYIAMEYVKGITLKEHLCRRGGTLPLQEVVQLFRPLMTALTRVHQSGLVHRDISPDNIMLTPDGKVRLIDFGAAHAASMEGDKSTQAVLKHGFAPAEQYTRRGQLGPWTDVYAICATLYTCLTGLIPPPVTERMLGEDEFRWEAIVGLNRSQRDALIHGLAVQHVSRIQTMEELSQRLFPQEVSYVSETGWQEPQAYTAPVVPVHTTPVQPKAPPVTNRPVRPTPPAPQIPAVQAAPAKKKFPWPILAAILAVVVLAGALLFFLKPGDEPSMSRPDRSEQKNHEEEDSESDSSRDKRPMTDAPAADAPAVATEITLWTYPIGDWGNENALQPLLEHFQAETGIKVNVKYLNYANGDDEVNTAILKGTAPDLILEGPERLVANWGMNGNMVDLSDMIDTQDREELNAVALAACYGADRRAYMYPLTMTVHCMAINKTAFEAAGAMQYIDRENHTWTTDGFINAVEAVYDHTGGKTVGTVYCGGQGGDQGTRALVNNLYGGTFTNAEHTAYTWDDPGNIRALEQLLSMDGIRFNDDIVGGDEIDEFYKGQLNMAFCWNIVQSMNYDVDGNGNVRTANGDEIMLMAFPSENGYDARLCGGIWGFGIFDNGDDSRIEAARIFIRYMCDSEATAEAVRASGYFPVRLQAENADLSGIWDNDPVRREYSILVPMLGDYYQVTPGWSNARGQWYKMLQDVGLSGGNSATIAAIVDTYLDEANNFQ